MKKSTLMLLVSLVLAIVLSVGSTLAYLTDTDADINTMTLGNVQIVQNEQERVKDAAGKPTNVLDQFTQNQTAFPAVGKIDWAEEGLPVNGKEYKVFSDDLKNVIDKIVTVTNTGKSEAYVRTIVALEAPDYDPKDLIHINVNSSTGLTKTGWKPVDIEGVKYVYSVFTYSEALKPGETSTPSLLQVFLDSAATNDDCAAFGETWDILVISQAVQAAGFADPAAALNEAFGEADEDNTAEWMGSIGEEGSDYQIGSPDGEKNDTNNPPEKEMPTTSWADYADTSWYDADKSEYSISTGAELAGVAKLASENNNGKNFAGKTFILAGDIDLGGHLWTPINIFTPEKPFTFDGAGHTVSNMTISNMSDAGLIGSAVGTVKNVTIDGAVIKSKGRTAAVAAKLYGNIINCHVKNTTIEDSYWAVGVIAGLYNSGSIKDCSVTNTKVTSKGGTGGIVGVLNETSGTRAVENCHVYNSVINNTGAYGAAYSGAGIVGMVNISNSTVNITGCTVDAALQGEHIFEIIAPVDEDITLNIN